MGAVYPFDGADPLRPGFISDARTHFLSVYQKQILFLSIRIAGGMQQLRITGTGQPGGRSPSEKQAGLFHRVVQGFSMPRQGCGKPVRVVHTLVVWATLWATLWESPEHSSAKIQEVHKNDNE